MISRAGLAAVSALLLVVHAGCATAPKPRAAETPAPKPLVETAETECRKVAARAVEIGDPGEAFGAGLLFASYLILRGAGEGAYWGLLSGGRAGDGALIGAAVGAGVGVLIGLAVGASKGIDAHGRYRASYDGCIASR